MKNEDHDYSTPLVSTTFGHTDIYQRSPSDSVKVLLMIFLFCAICRLLFDSLLHKFSIDMNTSTVKLFGELVMGHKWDGLLEYNWMNFCIELPSLSLGCSR